uniref:Zinc finger CCCH domain-containing protein 7 n=1 Tax=Lygus hesperus TaxID=30085 RepID=A0A0A9XEB9_LYGHE
MMSKRRPGEGNIKPDAVPSHSLLLPLLTQTDTLPYEHFHIDPRGPINGLVPGINAPFLGEMDHKMMQAMSKPLNPSHTLTANNGRFSKLIYLNEPTRNQALSGNLAQELNVELDKATNAVYSKLTVLTAAQSGLT